MTQSKLTYDERLRHIDAVRRVAVAAVLPLDPRVQRNALDVLDFIAAHIEELPAGASRMAVPMAADYIHRGTLINRRTVTAALGHLARLGLIIRVKSPDSGGTSVWTFPTDLREQAAALPAREPNHWATPDGRAHRIAGAALTAEQAEADRLARLRRAAATSLRRRGAPVDDDTVAAEIARASAQTPAQSLAQSSAQTSARTSAQSSAPKNRDDYSLRSPAVGGADGLGASGTTAPPPRSDGGGGADTTSDATTTDPRQAVAAGPGRPAEHDAQRRVDTEQVAPPNDNPWLALRELALARKAAEQSGDAA